MVNVTLTLIPVCLFCSIVNQNDSNATSAAVLEAMNGLPEILSAITPAKLPETLSDLMAENKPGAPPGTLRSESIEDSFPKFASIFSASPLVIRQAPTSVVQELLTPLTNALGNLLRRRPQPAAPEAELLEKAVHNDHQHFESGEALPEGVVAAGHYYEGTNSKGETFNEETDEVVPLEVHSHDEVSPGKVYDEKSDHPYYIVDKPAEGPAPPPLSYFTSALRSGDAATWDAYYATIADYKRKLDDYNNLYYQRTARNMDADENAGVKAENEVASLDIKTNAVDTTIDRILEENQAAVV